MTKWYIIGDKTSLSFVGTTKKIGLVTSTNYSTNQIPAKNRGKGIISVKKKTYGENLAADWYKN